MGDELFYTGGYSVVTDEGLYGGGYPAAEEVPWGAGAQDWVYGADVPQTPQDVSSSDVVRGRAAATDPNLTALETAQLDYGQAAYVSPQDPTMTGGVLDWSKLGVAFAGLAQAVGNVSPLFAGGHDYLAGVNRPGVGTPAPGGNPGARGLWSLPLPGGKTLAFTPSSVLLYGGLALGLVWLVGRGGR